MAVLVTTNYWPLHYLITEVTTSQDVPGFVSNAVPMPFINEVRTNTGLASNDYLTSRRPW